MGAEQLQVAFRQLQNQSTWQLDCDNCLYTYRGDYDRSLSFSLVRANLQ
jgi:hypothetical protein